MSARSAIRIAETEAPKPELPSARLVHRIPGRVRIRIDSRTGDRDFFVSLCRKLAQAPGVRATKPNCQTGSAVIEFHGDWEKVAEEAEMRALFRLVSPIPEIEPRERFLAWMATADRRVRSFSGGQIDLRAVLSATFFGLGVFQLSQRKFLPAASSLMEEALRIWQMPRQPHEQLPEPSPATAV